MADANAFSKMVPGFDFLQGLVKNAGAALPNVGQWIAPTVNPEELEKRINELRTVQFWLEQNARMLGTTIQAMEVQRMTLSTLKTMNVSMADLRDSLTLKMPDFGAAASAAAEPSPKAAPKPAADEGEEAAAPAAAVDPMQWWGALTKQFTELATNSLQDGTADAARNLASAMVKQSLDTAGATLKTAVNMPAEVAKQAASVVSKAAEVGQAVVKEAAARKTARKTASASADKTASAATKSPSAKTTARKTATSAPTKAAAKPAGRS